MVDISIDKGFARIELNLDVYGLETMYSVAFQMSDYAYIYFHKGSAGCMVVVNISYQDEDMNTDKNLSEISKDFLNHLINYNVYKFNAEKKYLFRSMLIQKLFDNPQLAGEISRIKDANEHIS